MNKTKILGIILFITGLSSILLLDKYELGFLGGLLFGIITALGLGLTIYGKLNFWSK
jgi:hypothetical protein